MNPTNLSKSRFVIQGLGGQRTLAGEIRVGGAKNAALKALSAAPLFDGPVRYENIPHIEDVSRMVELLEKMGAKVSRNDGVAEIDATTLSTHEFDRTLTKRMRASIVLTGPILARAGSISFPHPGGCVLGARPVDLFLEGFEKMGASVVEEDEWFHISTKSKKLQGTTLFFRLQSVTATETFMMAGVLAEGITILKNCAMEPEIAHLAEYLVACGASITGAGTPTITIEGGGLLHASIPYKTMPDRIEAGSFLLLSALAAKEVRITDCDPLHLESLTESLKYIGVSLETGPDWISVKAPKKVSHYKPLLVRTHEYPGFPTDLQAPMTVFLTQSAGESTVFETIFEGRLAYTQDLVRMGADIKMYDAQHAIIKGPTLLRGKDLESPDIRAGLAYVMAGIVAEGETTVGNVYYVDRGYERIEERLSAIGVPITRMMEVCEPQ